MINKNHQAFVCGIKSKHLSDKEKKKFDYSIKAVQELFNAAKKIDNILK